MKKSGVVKSSKNNVLNPTLPSKAKDRFKIGKKGIHRSNEKEGNCLYFLRVLTNLGEFLIPLTCQDDEKFMFNWIMYENPIEIFMIQLLVKEIVKLK